MSSTQNLHNLKTTLASVIIQFGEHARSCSTLPPDNNHSPQQQQPPATSSTLQQINYIQSLANIVKLIIPLSRHPDNPSSPLDLLSPCVAIAAAAYQESLESVTEEELSGYNNQKTCSSSTDKTIIQSFSDLLTDCLELSSSSSSNLDNKSAFLLQILQISTKFIATHHPKISKPDCLATLSICNKLVGYLRSGNNGHFQALSSFLMETNVMDLMSTENGRSLVRFCFEIVGGGSGKFLEALNVTEMKKYDQNSKGLYSIFTMTTTIPNSSFWKTSTVGKALTPILIKSLIRDISMTTTRNLDTQTKQAMHVLSLVTDSYAANNPIFDPDIPEVRKIDFRKKEELGKKKKGAANFYKSFWESFFEIYEILEEPQVHIIQPVLKKLDVFEDEDDNAEVSTWLLVLLSKMIRHDNKVIVKDGLRRFLLLGRRSSSSSGGALATKKEFVTTHLFQLIKDHVGWVLGNEPDEFLRIAKQFGQFIVGLHDDSSTAAAAEMILCFMVSSGKCLSTHAVHFFIYAVDTGVFERCHGNFSMTDVADIIKLLSQLLSNGLGTVSKYFCGLIERHVLNIVAKVVTGGCNNETHLDDDVFSKVLVILGCLGKPVLFKNRKVVAKVTGAILDDTLKRKLLLEEDSFVRKLTSSYTSAVGLYRLALFSDSMATIKDFVKRILEFLSPEKRLDGITIRGILHGALEYYENSLGCHGDIRGVNDAIMQSFRQVVSVINSEKRLGPWEFAVGMFHVGLLGKLIEISRCQGESGRRVSSILIEILRSDHLDDKFKKFLARNLVAKVMMNIMQEPSDDGGCYDDVWKELSSSWFRSGSYGDSERLDEFTDEKEELRVDEICGFYLDAFKTNVLADYYKVKFWSIGLLLSNNGRVDSEERDKMLEYVLNNLEKCDVSGVAVAMGMIGGNVKGEMAEAASYHMTSIAKVAWTSVFELRKTEAFWVGYRAFVEFIVTPGFVRSGGLREYATKILENGETIPGLGLEFTKRLLAVNFSVDCLESVHGILLDFALAGWPVPKNNRVGFELWDYLSNHGDPAYGNDVELSVPKNGGDDEDPENFTSDCKSRILAATKLRQDIRSLINQPDDDDDDDCRQLGYKLLKSHVTCLIERNEAESTAKKKRYFGGSMTHRVKQRVLQVLLVLWPVVAESRDLPLATKLLTNLLNHLAKDSPQPSVRYMSEWLVTLIIVRFPYELSSLLFESLDEFLSSRVGYGAFFSTMCLHISKELKTVEFYDRALKRLASLAFYQHVVVRVYSQIAFQRLYETAESFNHLSSLAGKYAPVLDSLTSAAMHITGNCARLYDNVNLRDFYVNLFDCGGGGERDYCLEVIFVHLPKISGMIKDEWCVGSSTAFMNELLFDEDGSGGFNNELDKFENWDTTWQLRTLVADGRELGEELPEEEEDQETTNNTATTTTTVYQKKLNPWKLIKSNDLSQFSHNFNTKKSRISSDDGGLIIVASLLEQSTNLGGLCRTIEIFGVSRFVVGSLKVLNDQGFQGLSVSAERWVNVMEVSPRDLKSFLSTYASKGYGIFGVEQASDSVCLKGFRFPEKSVLVLGNEKKGIPNDLLHLVDNCIEIPQVGIIRSLNVHVTGALCIWQYATQHIIV